MKTIYKKLLFLLLILPFSVLAQSILSGVVSDNTGQPVPGVNVVVQGTTNGVSTDFDGRYELTNVKSGDVVIFSYVGYANSSVTIGSQTTANVTLQEDANQLSEVVVQVGYGTVRRKDATGSLTTVTARDFNRGANVTTENLVNGKVAGLTINTSGAPGSGSQIRIRGGGSLFASNDPLIVIDGLPISNSANTGSTSILASLNPNTVESITVLKDASATAIYGSRASNGVILIVTKKGGKELNFDYDFQYGSGRVIETVDVFSGDQFRALVAERQPGLENTLGTANTNWQDAIYRRTDFVDQSFSIRGNFLGIIPSRITLGNTYQEGLRLTNVFKRNSVGVTLNPSFFKDHLKMRVNANYANERNRFADGVEFAAIIFDPTQPIFDANSPYGGYFQYYTTNPITGQNQLAPIAPRNPVAQLMRTYDTGINDRVFGNIELDYKFHFFPSLRVVINGGFDEANGTRRRLVPANEGSAPSNGNVPYGNDEYSRRTRRNKLVDAYLIYNKSIDKLTFDFTGGYSFQEFAGEEFFTGNRLNLQNLSNPQFPETNPDTKNTLLGFFGRTNLNYNDKYLLTFSFRREASSKFSPEDRWANFPAGAFAWRLNEEFFKGSEVVSDLKLKLGYGVTGQQDIQGANDYLAQYNTGSGTSQYNFGGVNYPIAIAARRTDNLKWEEAATANIGLDFGFLDNRFTGSAEVYYRETTDLLVDGVVPDGANFSNRAYLNIGDFTTKGVEFSLNAAVFRGDNFNWNVNFNFTAFERKVTRLQNGTDFYTGANISGTGTPGQILREGYTPFSFYVFKQLYNDAGDAIEGAYADLNSDGIINQDDKYIYKNPDPDAVLGLSSNLNYKNLDFSFTMRASIGNRNLNGVNAGNAQYANLVNGVLQNLPTAVQDYDFTTTSNVLLSDVYVENASFLRMDNITLGYTFTKGFGGTGSVRLFTGVQNAFVLTKYSGLDPEITNGGVDQTIYPRQRSFLFGANVKF